jgi:hypothetical protein
MSKWEELEKAARAATPGPWMWDSDPIKGDPLDRVRFRVVARGRTITQCYYSSGDDIAQKEAAYIAAANPSAILELLAERDALKKEMRDVAMLLLDNDRAGIKQWAAGVVLGESDGNWSVRTTIADQQKEIDALKAELDRIKAMEPFGTVTVRHARFEHHADQYQFFPAGHPPYLDTADECHVVYTLEKP